MLDYLYLITIYPIEVLIHLAFSFFYAICHDAGWTLIALSVFVSTATLPMYRRADEISDEERSKQESMKPMVDHIKKTFKGEEKVMMLSTYYRQQNYKPIYALRSSVFMLLQIPFFFAAYYFLSLIK